MRCRSFSLGEIVKLFNQRAENNSSSLHCKTSTQINATPLVTYLDHCCILSPNKFTLRCNLLPSGVKYLFGLAFVDAIGKLYAFGGNSMQVYVYTNGTGWKTSGEPDPFQLGSGCGLFGSGSFGRAVVSYTRGWQFESHRDVIKHCN